MAASHKQHIYTGFIIILLMGLGYVFILEQEQLQVERTIQVEFLHNELESFIVPPVEVNGKHYEVDGGIVFKKGKQVSLRESLPVLKIAHYAVINRLDPVFALEGTDVDILKKSIEYLISSLETFAPQYESDEEERIRERLYPIQFLQSLVETEALRQQLVASPTKNLVERYHTALGTTITLYQDAVRRFRIPSPTR